MRLSPRAGGFLGGLALLLGVVLIADALLTVLWEDPLTAVFTQQEQTKLSKKLDAAANAPLPASTLELARRAGNEQQRMTVLAAHLRTTTKSGDPLGRVSIPRTGTNFVFVAGTGEESLKKGPGHYATTALPGEGWTVGIAGHRTTYAAPFRHLDKLRRGDSITLTMSYGKFRYTVVKSRVVSPSNTDVLKPTSSPKGKKGHSSLVLTTCTPLFSAAKRIAVTARLEGVTPRGQAIQIVPVPPIAPQLGSQPR